MLSDRLNTSNRKTHLIYTSTNDLVSDIVTILEIRETEAQRD